MQDATTHLRASTSVRKLRKRRRWISAPIGWRTGNRDGRVARRQGTATLVASDNQPEGQVAILAGQRPASGQRRGVRRLGILPYISKFDAAGKLVFNAQFPAGVNT